MAASILFAAEPGVSDLSFFSGCWEIRSGALLVEEAWSSATAGTLFGWSRTIRDGKTVQWELMRIEMKDGKPVFVPSVSGSEKPVEFKAVRSSATEVVFENLAHDFPQRIIYKRNGADLDARIEGTIKGQARGKDFPYKRVACAGR